MSSLIPKHEGILPYWLLLTSAASILNTAGCYIKPSVVRRTYGGPAAQTQVTDLAARLFGTWTFLAFILRTYAAYNIDNRDIYNMTLWTYGIALVHFASEWLVFGTMSLRTGLLVPFTVATTSTTWMLMQWSYYVKA